MRSETGLRFAPDVGFPATGWIADNHHLKGRPSMLLP
jgi:hypothetical protein